MLNSSNPHAPRAAPHPLDFHAGISTPAHRCRSSHTTSHTTVDTTPGQGHTQRRRAFLISRSVGGRAASGWRAGGRFEKQKTENKRGPGGPGPPLGVENTPKGAKEAARGSSIRWEQEGWRLGSALNKGFQVLDQYWCRHTSPHEVSGAQCLSRRLILAVFELVFVFSLGGPTTSEAAGGRPLTQRSKRSATLSSHVLRSPLCTVENPPQ